MKNTLFLAGLLFSGAVSASGIPTVDVPNYIQTVKSYAQDIKHDTQESIEWLRQKKKDVEEMKELYEQGKKLQSQVESLNGDYAMGWLLDSPEYRRKRRAIGRSLDEIKEGYGTAEDFAEEVGVPVDRARQYITNLAVSEASEKQIVRADERITIGEEMIEAIDDNPDNKAALDLNNRMLAEIIISMAEDAKIYALSVAAENEYRLEEMLRRESDTRMSR